MFKSHSKDHQQRFEAAKFKENPKTVPRAPCMTILEGVAHATQKTAEGVDIAHRYSRMQGSPTISMDRGQSNLPTWD